MQKQIMKLIINILMILILTILIEIVCCKLSAIANFVASNMTITAVYIVISIILIILKIKEGRN